MAEPSLKGLAPGAQKPFAVPKVLRNTKQASLEVLGLPQLRTFEGSGLPSEGSQRKSRSAPDIVKQKVRELEELNSRRAVCDAAAVSSGDKSYPGICLCHGLSEMLGLLNSILLLLFGSFTVRQGLSVCLKLTSNLQFPCLMPLSVGVYRYVPSDPPHPQTHRHALNHALQADSFVVKWITQYFL